MRVVFVALLLVGLLFAAVALAGKEAFARSPRGLGLALGLGLVGLGYLLTRGLNRGPVDELGLSGVEAGIEQLARQGLLVETVYRARRALAIAEFEDEGSHYFVELEDGRALFLTGQHLYAYEPVEEDVRRFPCTRFTLRHEREHGYTLDLVCTGDVIEPELLLPNNVLEVFGHDPPMDREVLADETYESLRGRLLSVAAPVGQAGLSG